MNAEIGSSDVETATCEKGVKEVRVRGIGTGDCAALTLYVIDSHVLSKYSIIKPFHVLYSLDLILMPQWRCI
jgi:hypothetical protein